MLSLILGFRKSEKQKQMRANVIAFVFQAIFCLMIWENLVRNRIRKIALKKSRTVLLLWTKCWQIYTNIRINYYHSGPSKCQNGQSTNCNHSFLTVTLSLPFLKEKKKGLNTELVNTYQVHEQTQHDLGCNFRCYSNIRKPSVALISKYRCWKKCKFNRSTK